MLRAALRGCRGCEAWSSGALEALCRCSDVEVWSSGTLQTYCGLGDAEVWRKGGLEAHCRRRDSASPFQVITVNPSREPLAWAAVGP